MSSRPPGQPQKKPDDQTSNTGVAVLYCRIVRIFPTTSQKIGLRRASPEGPFLYQSSKDCRALYYRFMCESTSKRFWMSVVRHLKELLPWVCCVPFLWHFVYYSLMRWNMSTTADNELSKMICVNLPKSYWIIKSGFWFTVNRTYGFWDNTHHH